MSRAPTLALLLFAACTSTEAGRTHGAFEIANGATRVDDFTVRGPRHYVSGYDAWRLDGRVNAVIEIPTGTDAKWEVDKADGWLRWEFRDGQPRVVSFLGYPGNYGMIPRTLLAAEDGGDGDPLDVIVLGPPLPRGAVVPVRLVAVLKLLDGGEQDDKLVAVREDTPFATVNDLVDLRTRFPGVTEQIEGWFCHYKGPGEIESLGFADSVAAMRVLRASNETYERAHR